MRETPSFCSCGKSLVYSVKKRKEHDSYTGKELEIVVIEFLRCPERRGFLGFENRNHDEWVKTPDKEWEKTGVFD